jgi:hypothetical protein
MMNDQNGNPLTPDALANMIKADPNFHPGEKVELMACNTGLPYDSLPPYLPVSYPPFAQLLANSLGQGQEVLGANNFYWPEGDGFIAPVNTPGIGWWNINDAALHSGPNLMQLGSFNSFTGGP